MRTRIQLLTILSAVFFTVAGCATTPQVDERFGEASAILKAQQTRDPVASVRNADRPVDGLEGRAASNAVDQYYKSFTKEPPPMPIINFGLQGTR